MVIAGAETAAKLKVNAVLADMNNNQKSTNSYLIIIIIVVIIIIIISWDVMRLIVDISTPRKPQDSVQVEIQWCYS